VELAPLSRRRAVCAWLGLCLIGASGKARAGRYLDRAWLLVSEGSRANDFLAKRLYDRELGWRLPPSRA
jgi:hypothetical protein